MFKVANINKKRGFSFVELMIAVAIFGLLSMVTVSSYANFNNRIGVDTLAHQIAQFGHEAQVSALSVKRTTNNTYPGYGLHFEEASSTEFMFFADKDGNKMYTPLAGPCGSAGSECEKVIKLLKGVTISALCGNTTDSSKVLDSLNCVTAGIPYDSKVFDIVFRRPSPDANIMGKVDTSHPESSYSSAQVIIKSTKGYSKSVQFYITGQVTVR